MPYEPPSDVWTNYVDADMPRQIAARDLFAIGCYLRKTANAAGDATQSNAGIKACWSALEALGVPIDECHRFIDSSQFDRAWMAKFVAPHSEILDLF